MADVTQLTYPYPSEINSLIVESLAPVTLGTVFSIFLYALEVQLAIQYFRRMKGTRESPVLKWMVSFALIVNTFNIITAVYGTYTSTITHWGDVTYVLKVPWFLTANTICTGISCGILQSYLIFRIWRLNKNLYIVVFLSFLSVCTVVSSFLLGWSLLHFNDIVLADKLLPFVATTTAIATTADLFIALTLVIHLVRFHKETVFPTTKKWLNRLILLSVQTGGVTTIWIASILISFIINKQSNICNGISFPLGHGYSLTLLLNLAVRRSLLRAPFEISSSQPSHGRKYHHSNHVSSPTNNQVLDLESNDFGNKFSNQIIKIPNLHPSHSHPHSRTFGNTNNTQVGTIDGDSTGQLPIHVSVERMQISEHYSESGEPRKNFSSTSFFKKDSKISSLPSKGEKLVNSDFLDLEDGGIVILEEKSDKLLHRQNLDSTPTSPDKLSKEFK